MKFFKALQALRDANTRATKSSEAVLKEADQSSIKVERDHEHALMRYREAAEQAKTLSATDHRNHYSESMTQAFRGKPA